MATSLLTTKLHTPVPQPNLVPRPRLLQRLNQGLHLGQRLTLVSAPAGFGKTTLITEWLQQLERPHAWLSLDEEDNDPIRFLTYFVAALQQVDARIGQAVHSLLGTPQLPSADVLMTMLINDVADTPKPLVLVLDDYQLIKTHAIHENGAFLLEHQPPQLHIVLLTRVDPPLPLALRRARGQMNELRVRDLRFTTAEAAIFLNQVMALDLTPDQVATLEARTEGWITGLNLAALSLRGQENIPAFLETFSGSHRYLIDYLTEEVLQQQPQSVRSFLYRTAILDRLTAPLCDVLIDGSISRHRLTQLEHDNLFIVPLDNEGNWYRYHHLFADYLRTQLAPEQEARLHRRAAGWYAANGFLSDGIKHALAGGDLVQAGRFIAQAAKPALQDGALTTLLGWLEALPDALVRADAELAIYKSWALYLTGAIGAATDYAQSAQASLSHKDQPACRGRLASLLAFFASDREDHTSTLAHARQALDLLDEQEPFFRTITLMALGNTQSALGDTANAIQTLHEAVQSGQRLDTHLATMLALGALALNYNWQGKRRQAVAICQQAIGQYVDESGQPLPIAGIVYIVLGILAYAGNQLAETEAYLQQGLGLCQQLSQMEFVLLGQQTLARLHQALGKDEKALATVQAARQMALESRSYREKNMLAAAEADLYLRQGDLAAAEHWAQEAAPQFADPSAPMREQAHLTYSRLLLAQDHPQEALRGLADLAQWARDGGRYGCLIPIHLLQALAHSALGHEERTRHHLGEALHLAAPEGYRQVFLDEGTTLLAHLPRVRAKAPDFVDQLLHEVTTSHDALPGLVDPFSQRELEILALTAAGYSNQEIAEQLVIALSTVKWYLNGIYNKLNVHSRTQAIARAQALGLL